MIGNKLPSPGLALAYVRDITGVSVTEMDIIVTVVGATAIRLAPVAISPDTCKDRYYALMRRIATRLGKRTGGVSNQNDKSSTWMLDKYRVVELEWHSRSGLTIYLFDREYV